METDFGNKSYTSLGFFKNWALFTIALFSVGIILDLVTDHSIFHYLVGLVVVLSLLLILRIVQLIYKRIESKKYDYQQTEALFSLYQHLNPGIPLPKMRNHAGSPDFLNLVVETLIEKKPKVVVEAGSGISSMVISEWLLQHAPNTQHLALDHEAKYADLTRKKIRNPNTEIVFAPLREYQLQGGTYRWYDLDRFQIPENIDLLIVDGPPTPRSKHARYPAIPLLEEHFSESVVIILDDGIRQQEQEIVSLWKEKFNFIGDFIPLEKGAYVLNRSK